MAVVVVVFVVVVPQSLAAADDDEEAKDLADKAGVNNFCPVFESYVSKLDLKDSTLSVTASSRFDRRTGNDTGAAGDEEEEEVLGKWEEEEEEDKEGGWCLDVER